MASEKDLKPAKKQVETYSPEDIYIKGSVLQEKLFTRVARIEVIQAEMMGEIVDMLKRGAGEDGDPVAMAATVMVALADTKASHSAHAMSMRAFINRAAALQAEQRDLVRFGKTLMPGAAYKLTWEEADRFGI